MQLSSNLLPTSRWMLPAYGEVTLRCNRISIAWLGGWILLRGVSYFRGYVDRQEAREERRMRREEERAMREPREYEEPRRMNELLWQQSEAIRQLEQ